MESIEKRYPVYAGRARWRKLLSFGGPGLLVAVGYMDPGNWATDLAAGSRYGYRLLFVVLLSNLMAILLQTLATRLGLVTGRDLARACRDYYSRPVVIALWILCEIAIIACDLAEVLGSAIALQLLFGLPLIWGVCLTAFDALLILTLQSKGIRLIEAFAAALIAVIAICFVVEIYWAQPVWSEVLRGLLPDVRMLGDLEMLYLAVGILGATVMPHNLYLHSSIVQTRDVSRTPEGIREAIGYNLIDVTAALSFAFFINAAILVLAASVFYKTRHYDVAEIHEAYKLLTPLLGSAWASVLFAVALLCAGQNATLTGTLAGQIVMEGFMKWRIKPWQRRLLTRLLAIIPAVIITALYGAEGSGKLLVLSQVVLSLQLSFAVIPLILFTSDREKMGEFVNPLWLRILSWAAGILIAGLNAWMLWQFLPMISG
jgi:manganese transport protein